MIAVFETHPVQYHAPIWRELAAQGIPLKVFYGGDFSVKGYKDKDFGVSFSWDTDLLTGYEYEFLNEEGCVTPRNYDEVKTNGISKTFDKINPGSVLALGYSHPFDRQVILTAIRRKIPLLYRGEANDSAKRRSIFKSAIRGQLLNLLYKRCDGLLYIGEEARRHYMNHGCSSQKLIFSPYSIDRSHFITEPAQRKKARKIIRESLGISDEEQVVLFSGKLTHRKGVDILAQAAAGCQSDLVVLYLGDGEMRQELEKRFSKKGRLILAGFQNQKKLTDYYVAANMLALPSRHSETWGLVVNEALAHGIPAVVSDAVGCRWDLIHPGKTGEIATRGDAESLRDAMDRCMVYNRQPECTSACLETVAPYSIENAANGIREAWRKIEV